MQRWWPWEPRVPWRTAPSPPPTCCRHAAACVFSCPARALPDRSALLPAVTHIHDRGQRSDRTTPAFSLLETMKLHSQRSDWVLNGNCFHQRLFTCREQKPVGRWRHCCRWVRLTGIPSAMARIAQSFKKNKKNGVVAANVSFRFLSVGVVPDTAAAAAAGLAASPQPTQDAVGISD